MTREQPGACEPGCGFPPGHVAEHPCGKPHVPGSPCDYCGKPTPLDGAACPDCWTSLVDRRLADLKALMARVGFDLATPHGPST